MDLKTRHVSLARCSFSSPSRRLRNRIRFRHKDEKSHRYGIHKLLSLRQQEGRVCPRSSLRVVRLDLSSPDLFAHHCDVLGGSALAHLGHRSTQLHELKAVLAQLSNLHAALQLIHSHAGHLRLKFAMAQQLRTQDPKQAFAEAQQVADDMLTNAKKVSELVGLGAALEEQLRLLREDCG